MYLLGFGLYALLSGTIAWLVAKLATRRVRQAWARWTLAAILAPVMFFLPLADEIVGYFQFERLCEQAKEVKIYGTIPVGEDLYTPEGKWRIGLAEGEFEQRLKDWDRARKAIAAYIRSEYRRLPDVRAAIDIWAGEEVVFDVKTGRKLAEWRQFGTSGGWLSRNFEVPLIVRSQCMPQTVLSNRLEQTLLPFDKNSEMKK